ncbi:MAG: GtrA family protein [Candidatus Saccharibacteria bacterium]|nr:GtrA family protein [Candidatus Saccharibacteria bacterium]
MNKKKELLLFAVAGVLGYLVDAGVTTILHPLIGPYLARIPAFIGAATATWVFNRTLTFVAADKIHKSLMKEYFHYLSLMLLGLVVNYIVYAVSITFIGSNNYSILICVALGSLAGMVVNFINTKRYLYRSKDIDEI